MELPFKYIVLCIIKELNERNMPLEVSRSALKAYITTFINKAFLSISEKIELGKNFNLDYELSDLTNKYSYFDVYDDKITFDIDYVYELDSLIEETANEYDIDLISDSDFTIEINKITFLEIIGVKIRKELYEFLKNVEIEIKDCYSELYKAKSYAQAEKIDTSKLINKIKILYMKKKVLLINTKNLLPRIEYSDLIKYASSMIDKNTNLEDISLLYEDEDFDAGNIMYDTFLRSIFTSEACSASILWESLVTNLYNLNEEIKQNITKFYQTFLNLLDKEIPSSNNIIGIEMTRIKYGLINALDSVYDTTLFMNDKDNITSNQKFDENYQFIESTVYYFIKELLMYDDNMYKNKEYNTDNIMVYLNNIMKKLLIETYYHLTKDENIINAIKNNELYGINTISSNYLKSIIDKPKTKIKDK